MSRCVRQEAVRKGCVFSIFSVVASYSNLSTYHFTGTKIMLSLQIPLSASGINIL